MTAVADTRLLLTLQFPPTKELKARIEETITRELAGRLVAPSVVSTEFLKIAGARIGESTAELRLNLLKERGMKVIPITEEMALNCRKATLVPPGCPHRRCPHSITGKNGGRPVRRNERPALPDTQDTDQMDLRHTFGG